MVSNKFTPREKSGFKWNIDDISMIKPADIDETSLQQHESIEDPAVESFAQANIDRFFSMKEIVPSPFHKVNPKPLVNLVSTKDSMYHCFLFTFFIITTAAITYIKIHLISSWDTNNVNFALQLTTRG